MENNGISQVPVGPNSYSCGTGYVIIPSDSDRQLYIARCMRTAKVMIYSEQGQVHYNVDVDIHVLQQIEFPETNDQLGSCVVYINYPIHNKPIIIATLTKNDEIKSLNNDQFEIIKQNSKSIVQIFGDRSQSNLTVNVTNIDGSSEMSFNCLSNNNSAKINFNSQGHINFNSLFFSAAVQNLLTFSVGFKDDKIQIEIDKNSISITNKNKDRIILNNGQIEIVSEKIILGDNEKAQPTILSQQLITQLKLNKLRIDALFNAIKSAPIVPQDGGASFKASLIAATSGLKPEDYSNVTSDVVKNS